MSKEEFVDKQNVIVYEHLVIEQEVLKRISEFMSIL